LFADPLHGSIEVGADGSFSYTAEAGYEGLDAFLYRVSDGELWSPLAAVTIRVTAADDPDETPLPEPSCDYTDAVDEIFSGHLPGWS
jgi:hypothetical protein